MRLSRAVQDTLVGALIAVGALASVVLLVTTTYFTILCLIGIGFLALPHLTTAVRWVCDLNRRAAARSGVPVERPYRPEPEEIERDIVGWVRRCKWILADPASWRDLLWLLLNSVVGLLLGSAPAAMLYYAGRGWCWPAACGSPSPPTGWAAGTRSSPWTAGPPPSPRPWRPSPCPPAGSTSAPGSSRATPTSSCSCWARPREPAWNPGSGTSRRHVPALWTSRPPRCAASNAICTTAPRPGWSASASPSAPSTGSWTATRTRHAGC